MKTPCPLIVNPTPIESRCIAAGSSNPRWLPVYLSFVSLSDCSIHRRHIVHKSVVMMPHPSRTTSISLVQPMWSFTRSHMISTNDYQLVFSVLVFLRIRLDSFDTLSSSVDLCRQCFLYMEMSTNIPRWRENRIQINQRILFFAQIFEMKMILLRTMLKPSIHVRSASGYVVVSVCSSHSSLL